MGVGLLFEASLEEYLEKEGDAPDALWFFLHIPKTAGSSFRSELARRLQPERNLAVDYEQGESTLPAQREAALQRFIEEAGEKRYRFASGHVQHPSVARIREAHPNTRVVTMLRDPVRRLVSDYRYQLTPMHPPHERFRAEFPTFEAYANDRRSRNKMYKFLAAHPGEPVSDVIRRVTETYSFVGLLEMYPLCFRLMSLLLGGTAEPPTLHARRTPDTPDNTRDLDAVPADTLRAWNRRDQAIYDHFRGLFARRVRAIRAEIGPVHRERLRERRLARRAP